MKTKKPRKSKRLQTDHPFYRFMQDYPKQMFELLGVADLYTDEYEFSAPIVKRTEYRPDGLYRGKSKTTPMIFVEINFYKADNIYYKTLAESWLIYSQTTDRPESFYVFIIFDRRENDPGRNAFIETCMQALFFRVLYLDEILNQLPDNPYFTVLKLMVSKPNFEKDLETIQKVYQNFAETDGEYLDLCVILLSSKYKEFTLDKLYAMLPNFREELMQSRAIQQIVAEALTPALQANTEQVTLQTAINFSRNLIDTSDLSADYIAKVTGLSVSEVKKLMKEAGKA